MNLALNWNIAKRLPIEVFCRINYSEQQSPLLLGIFVIFLEKELFNTAWIMFRAFLKSFEINKLLKWETEMETGRVDRHRSVDRRSGYQLVQYTLAGRSSRLKHRSNSPFLQLKDILAPTEINKIFYEKNSVNKPQLLKRLVEWFQTVADILWQLRHAHPGAYLRGGIVPSPSPLWPTTQRKKVQNMR